MTTDPPQVGDLRDEILWDLQHEDDKQVFEVWWSANTAYPHAPLSERLRLAEGIVGDLLRSGEASLYRLDYAQEVRSEIEDQTVALREEATWLPINNTSDRVWIEATNPPSH